MLRPALQGKSLIGKLRKVADIYAPEHHLNFAFLDEIKSLMPEHKAVYARGEVG